MIVHANADDISIEVGAGLLADGAERDAGRGHHRSQSHIGCETAQIVIEIFELGAPLRREEPLDAAVNGPAGAAVPDKSAAKAVVFKFTPP